MKMIILVAAALTAAPALAQAQGAPEFVVPPDMRMHDPRGDDRGEARGGGRWAAVSPAGRAILRDALRPADRAADRAAVQAVRNRMNAVIAADRLDVNALRAAMAEERRLVDAMQGKRQDAMLAAIQKLTPADRKAFAAAADQGRERMTARAGEWREWARRYREGRQLPPPPAPAVRPAGT